MDLEGMEQLLREIERMGLEVETQLEEQALQAGAEILKSKIEETVPVRTGKLKANIVVSDVKNGSIDIGPDQQGEAFYGHFLEFGTSKAKAQPFMGPAFESNKQTVQDKMADVIKRGLRL
jgi:HK97 gp10 family phage protein